MRGARMMSRRTRSRPRRPLLSCALHDEIDESSPTRVGYRPKRVVPAEVLMRAIAMWCRRFGPTDINDLVRVFAKVVMDVWAEHPGHDRQTERTNMEKFISGGPYR
jgi:hypothetical protein